MNPLETQLQINTFHPQISPFSNQIHINTIQNNQSLNDDISDKNNHNHNKHAVSSQLEQEFNPTLKLKSMFFYLYFLQGIILSMAGTMPYVYKQLPTYDTMAIFSLTILPFSLKFLTAPFLQKYNHVHYGKRKTWIVISQIATSFMVLLASYYTDFQYSKIMAIFLFFTVFCICLQDIALDGLAIKQLKVPHIASLMQAVGQTFGLIVGSLVLLKLTSEEFSQQINLNEPIASCSLLFKISAALIIIPTILFHLGFHENVLQNEKQVAQMPFKEVVKCYKIFFNKKSRHFRTCVLFFIWVQGINFFLAGYEYELIQSGFSRNDLNTISNIAVIPISIATCLLTSKIQSKFGLNRSIYYVLIAYMMVISLVLIFFPKDYILVSLTVILLDVLSTWLFLVNSIINTTFPVTGVTGMYLTMLACVSNFGRFRSLHTKLLGEFGWVNCSVFGLFVQAFILYKLKDILTWVQNGSYNTQQIKVSISSQDQDNIQMQQIQQETN